MKLQILLAMMLLTVVAFAQTTTNDSTNVAVDSSVTNDETISVSNGTGSEVAIETTSINQEDLGVMEDIKNSTEGPTGSTDDAMMTNESEVDQTTVDTTMTDEPEPTLINEDSMMDDGSGESVASYGTCEFDSSTEGGITKVVVECGLTLPNPCHTVEYGWVPGTDDSTITFAVHIKARGGMCAQVISKTEVRTEQRFNRETLNFNYKIDYVPANDLQIEPGTVDVVAAPVMDSACQDRVGEIKRNIERLEQQLERASNAKLDAEYERVKNAIREAKYSLETLGCVHEVIAKELPSASLCAKQRIEAEMRLNDLHLTLREAKNSDDTESAGQLESKIREVKAELENLPTVDACETTASIGVEPGTGVVKEKLGQFYERLRDFNVIMRVANPCDKVTYIDEKVVELQDSLADASEDEAAAIKDKIGVLYDLRENMDKACTVIKDNSDCKDAINMRNSFDDFINNVQAGNVDGVRLRDNAKDLIKKFTRLQSACLDDIQHLFDEHPCMGARVLEIEVERMSSRGDSPEILPEIYQKMNEFKRVCSSGEVLDTAREQVRRGLHDAREVKEKANDIAQLVGELELRKHLILADDSLSSTRKDELVKEIESEKTDLIKDAVGQFKRARITSATRVRLSKGEFKVEDEAFDSNNVTLELATTDGSLEATSTEDGVELRSERARIKARVELEFENGQLMIRGKAIRMPDEVLTDIGADSGELELNDDGETATYEGNVKRQFRLFAIIPLNADVYVKANATDGEILDTRRPWWAVFAVE